MKQPIILLSAITALVFSGCSSHSASDISIAKQTRPVALHTDNVNIRYALNSKDAQPYTQALVKSFKTHGITIDEASKTKITVHPVYLGNTGRFAKSHTDDPVIPATGLQKLEADSGNSSYIRNGVATGLMAGSNAHIDLKADTINSALKDVAGTAAITAVGAIAINYMLSTQGYELITDVYINQDERTRIFAYVEDSSIEPEEAISELALLTADKLADIIKGKN